MGIAARFNQTVTVETYLGSGAYGDTWAAPVTKTCKVQDGIQLTRDQVGAEVVSQTTLYGPIGDVDLYAPGSKVTVDSHVGRVIIALRRVDGPVGIHHCQIHLT